MSVSRVFESKPATREAVPLMIGLVGPSGSGKTFSALRLATGIQRVAAGKIIVIDTEARRALYYADKFAFEHVDFKAPFGPLDYLAAVKHCIAEGAKTIVIDSMSHEHEGPGGVLEQHDTEQERLAKQWNTSRDKVNMSAWQKPKGDRRRFLNEMVHMGINFIMCYRAKEKISLSGDKPKPLGWMPIAGEEYVYESSLTCLLYPNSGGVPSWQPDEMGEKAIIKLPGQFRDIFAAKAPLSEGIGEQLARWAAGTTTEAPEASTGPIAIMEAAFRALGMSKGQVRDWARTFGVEDYKVIGADIMDAALSDLADRQKE